MPDDEPSGGTPSADQSAYTTEDAVPPGGQPRGDAAPGDDGVGEGAAAEPAGAAVNDASGATSRELEEQRDRYLRLAAEYDNYRRRTLRERQEAGARAQADLVRSFLDVLDDLDRFAHVDAATTPSQTIVDGVAMVERKLLKALGAVGLEVVNPVDQQFDPALHEALTTVAAASPEEDHTVAQVYQPGYVFGGQLLRPARVVVRQWNG
ncbi:MAG TPA: nucleotide exchange factor GrpE [Gemmatimonadaceae bacterium]|nr:nucleotide exchange factor GrpE [Gemmatimonadaceae bacterium]